MGSRILVSSLICRTWAAPGLEPLAAGVVPKTSMRRPCDPRIDPNHGFKPTRPSVEQHSRTLDAQMSGRLSPRAASPTEKMVRALSSSMSADRLFALVQALHEPALLLRESATSAAHRCVANEHLRQRLVGLSSSEDADSRAAPSPLALYSPDLEGLLEPASAAALNEFLQKRLMVGASPHSSLTIAQPACLLSTRAGCASPLAVPAWLLTLAPPPCPISAAT